MKRPLLKCFRPILFLGTLIAASPMPAWGEDLADYGARMCADAGIAAEDCSLVTGIAPAPAADNRASGAKPATLIQRARWVCEQEGVPLEDCKALPVTHRIAEQPPAPVSPFLDVPEKLPPAGPALLPVATTPAVASPQPVARRSSPREVRALAPSAYRPPPEAPQPVFYRAPSYRNPPPPAVAALPVEPDVYYLEPPASPIAPGIREIVEPLPVERRALRIDQGERRLERFRAVRPSGRCLRSVRYSPPPSYRYVTC